MQILVMPRADTAKDEEIRAHKMENQNMEYLAEDNLVLKAKY